MGVLISVFLLLTLSVTTLCCPDQWWLHYQHQIYVDNQTSINDSSCWEGGYSTPCLSLNLALKGAQYYNHSIAILLQPGQHHLHGGSETQLWNVSQLAIVGNGSEGEVVIRCGPLAGLGFFWSATIEVRNVTVIGCGAVQNSTSKNTRVNASGFLQIQVAVHFCDCKDVVLKDIQINESNGTGVVLYNSLGMVCINSCSFSCNGWSITSYGGGGVVVESNLVSEPSSYNAYLQTYLNITNTIFINNTASSGQFSSFPLSTNPSDYFGLGRGGGLSVVFREGSANNTVTLSEVRFENNTAQFGGGIFLAFCDNASNNNITIDDSEVKENGATLSSPDISKSNGGGGLLTAFVATDASWPFDNRVTINNTNFTSNEAEYGGGIAVNVQNDQPNKCFTSGNKLDIDSCVFENNEAFQGSSAYFSQDRFGCQPLVDTLVCSSRFTNGHCGTSMKTKFGLPCSGNMILQKFSIFLTGSISFTSNQESALELHSSSIEVSSGTQLHFINNRALKGAALHLVDCNTAIVNNDAVLLILNNTATRHGGAIYAEGCDISQTGGRQCFVRHSNSDLHPNNWETNFIFNNNSVCSNMCDAPNSIYMDSIRPCIWPDTNADTSDTLTNTSDAVSGVNNTFCWRGWFYMNSLGVKEYCLRQLKSAPASVSIPRKPITIFPGDTFDLPVRVFDDWNRDVTAESTIHVQVTSGHARVKSTTGTSSDITIPNVTLLANCAYFDQISVLSVATPQLSGSIKVLFNSCEEATPWGGSNCSTFYGECVQSMPPGITCPSCMFPPCACQLTSSITIPLGTCLSLDGKMTEYLASGSCPTSYPRSFNKMLILNNSLSIKQLIMSYPHVSDLTCAPHREGRLCGNCTKGYGVAINSPDFFCTHCGSYSGVAIFVLLELLPVLMMMVMLTVLRINVTDGFLNGFVLYSQLLTLQFPEPDSVSLQTSFHSGKYIYKITSIVYSIWNLNFLALYLEPFCIPYADTAASAIALQYVIAALPLFFIALTYIWIQLYSRGNRSVVCVTRPVHKVLARFWQKFKIRPSLIDTYAGLILLSYMRFANISVNLLQYTTVSVVTGNNTESKTAFYYDANLDYFGWPHAAYGVLAIVCLLVFVVPLVTILLFYHLMIFQRCLSWCKLDRSGLHALVDVYQGCFKNSATDGVERRYFAGIYLLLRLCILLAIFLPILNIFNSIFIYPLRFIEVFFSLLMAGALALLRPYKKTAHNVTDFLLFFFMSMVFAWFSVSVLASFYFFGVIAILFLSFTMIPMAVLICYLTYRTLRWFCCTIRTSFHRRHQPVEEEVVEADERQPLLPPTRSEVNLADYSVDDLFADRVLHPTGYQQ